ncbi:MAG: glucan 1,4-alpha-glucosidase [Bacteroides sp. SM23_62_1]|nr:MAG: glucan 1,4-alpha-glucosidase [Bacteroides sp. SM23_62_1]
MLLSIVLSICFGSAVGQDYPFQNPDLSVKDRVNDLVSRMTLEEKISQMQNSSAAIPRLGIPEYDWWNECLHGVARNGVATVFPQAIGMAATWNPDLIGEEAIIISTEARAKYHEAVRNNERRRYQGLTFWSPNINIFRDPRWGRGQETYGEDPFLTSRIGVAFVKGLQGDDPYYFKVVSTPKHFAVHSGPEPLRHSFDVNVSNRDLYETYLPAFKACITEGGAYSVMGAYNRFRGESCSASELLLDQILRQEWGFDGYVVSDCGAIRDIYSGHHIVETAAEASALAVKTGCDLTCGREYRALAEAISNKLTTENEIDISVRRLMTARFRLGMFDPPERDPYSQIPFSENDSEEHNRFALKVARESMVLLKNEKSILPISGDVKTIAVIGPYADNIDVLLGNYNGIPSDPVTILQGIINRAPQHTEVLYSTGILPPEAYLVSTPVDSEFLRPSGDQTGKGLMGEYFNNPDLKGSPVVMRIDPMIQMFWRLESPGEGIPNDNFSVRWTGEFIPQVSGSFEIGLFADEKVRLYLNDELVLDNWDPYERNYTGTVTMKFDKGREYGIKIEYADISEFARVRLMWRKAEEAGEDTAMMDEAVEMTKRSDITVMVAGISPRLEGEEMRIKMEGFEGGDRTSLQLPKSMQELIKRLHATGKPVILVLTGGSALAINWENDHIPAILHAWYPGQQGGNAVADVLFGNYNPAGRLPVTFYKSVEDLPPFEDYNMEGRTYRYFRGEPLYPFGYGLSFSEFQYEKIEVSKQEVYENDSITIRMTITNTGKYDGDEVIQLYVRDVESSVTQPIKSLKGFRRIFIRAGETKTIEIPLAINDLGYYDENKRNFVLEPGEFEIQIGSSSSDIRLITRLVLK